MKKLFAILIVATAMTACNDNTKTETKTSDSTTTVTPMAPDTAAMKMDSSASKMADTTKPKM